MFQQTINHVTNPPYYNTPSCINYFNTRQLFLGQTEFYFRVYYRRLKIFSSMMFNHADSLGFVHCKIQYYPYLCLLSSGNLNGSYHLDFQVKGKWKLGSLKGQRTSSSPRILETTTLLHRAEKPIDLARSPINPFVGMSDLPWTLRHLH